MGSRGMVSRLTQEGCLCQLQLNQAVERLLEINIAIRIFLSIRIFQECDS